MELRAPRPFVVTMAVVSAVFLGCLVPVLIGWSSRPLLLTPLALFLAWGAGSAAAIAVIGTRSVHVSGGSLTLTGFRGTTLGLGALIAPLEVGVFGVRLSDGTTRRRVFAQMPTLAATLVARLPAFAPQLLPADGYPVMLPGRKTVPVTLAGFSIVGIALGIAGLGAALAAPSAGGRRSVAPGLFGVCVLVASGVGIWWATRRAPLRIELYPDHLRHVHLVGARTTPLASLISAAVVAEARWLPDSRDFAPFHRLQLVTATGAVHELATLSAAWPNYPQIEGELMERRAHQLRNLAPIHQAASEILRSDRGHEMAIWDHGESSAGAHRYTFVFRRPVDGRFTWSVLHGRGSAGGSGGDFVLSHDDRVLYFVDVDLGTVTHVDLGAQDPPVSIRSIDAGRRSVMVKRADGPATLSTQELGRKATSGWSLGSGPLGVPNVTWADQAEALLAELASHPDADLLWTLLAARSFEGLRSRLQPTERGELSHPLFARVIDLGRHDDPVAFPSCTGSEMFASPGPDGRPECRTCGVVSSGDLGDHAWQVGPLHCSGTLRAPASRPTTSAQGTCRVCGLDAALTYDGLVRHHAP